MRNRVKYQALGYVNQIRRNKNLAPLSELPTGTPRDNHGCVIARGIQEEYPFYSREFMIQREEGCTKRQKISSLLFIIMFDTHQYPELIYNCPEKKSLTSIPVSVFKTAMSYTFKMKEFSKVKATV